MKNEEHKLQSRVVKEIYNRYPDIILFEVNNDVKGGIKAIMYRIALGMKAGISDLMIFRYGRLISVEVKYEGTAQNKKHIQDQLRAGKEIFDNGGSFIMSDDYDEIIDFVVDQIKGHETEYFVSKNYLKYDT